MKISDLKLKIEHKEIPEELVIFQVSDNDFICKQYITEISKFSKLPIKYANNLKELFPSDFFQVPEKCLYVLVTDSLLSVKYDLSKLEHTFIITHKTDDTVKEYVCEVPPLEEWQIKDYLQVQLPGVATDKLDWLFQICRGDIFRLNQEITKISIFRKEEQRFLFEDCVSDNLFSDLSSYTVFNLVNSLVKHDIEETKQICKQISNIDVDPIGLVTLLYQNFKNVLCVQLSVNGNAEMFGLSSKQFNAIRYNCGKYSNKQLVDIFQFLTSVDKLIKTGELPVDILVDYVVSKILSC